MAGISIESLHKQFPDGTVAVHEIDLEINDGELFVLLGPSGCGKTTTLRCIAGLETQTSGDIRIGDKLVNDLRPGERDIAITYRRSFGRYTVNRLLTSIMFYAAAAMLFFGVFVMRYRLELVLSFPLIALTMAVYLNVGLRPNSPAQHPESLYRERGLMATCAACALALMLCLWIDMPWLAELVAPLAPTR